jgi:hypothetical protein
MCMYKYMLTAPPKKIPKNILKKGSPNKPPLTTAKLTSPRGGGGGGGEGDEEEKVSLSDILVLG